MNRRTRLRLGKTWAKAYTGKRIIHAYSRKFKVTQLCAINDLKRYGIQLNQEDIDTILLNHYSYKGLQLSKAKLKEIQDRTDERHGFLDYHESILASEGFYLDEPKANDLDNDEVPF